MIISWGRAQKTSRFIYQTNNDSDRLDSSASTRHYAHRPQHRSSPSPPPLPLSIAPALFQICTGLWTSVVIVDYEYTKIFIYDTNKSPCGLRNLNPFTNKSGRHTIYFHDRHNTLLRALSLLQVATASGWAAVPRHHGTAQCRVLLVSRAQTVLQGDLF